jgi:peptidoglycan hydrolase CwlO-like protein
MSFGFSVGDFIAVLELANNIRKQFIDAPDQFKAISKEWVVEAEINGWMLIIRFDSVKLLSNVLRDVDDMLPQRCLTSQQEKDLDEIAQGCYNVLKKLEEKLENYQELDSSVKSIRGTSRRMWKRFQWNQKEIDQFRAQISLNISALDTFLGRITW